jgi:hypothetical protein
MDMELGICWRMTVLLLLGEYWLIGDVMVADGRQMEMLNIFMGVCPVSPETVEEADGSTNKLIDMRSTPQKVISLDCTSSPLREVEWKLMYSLAEEDRTLLSTMTRQFLHTHRPFKATIMNPAGEPILWVSK